MKKKIKKYDTGGSVLKSDSSGYSSNDDLRNFLKESVSRPLPETNNPELAKHYKEIRDQSIKSIKGPSGSAGGSDDLVKAMNRPYKIGGKVRTASQRADGIAQKGKTRA